MAGTVIRSADVNADLSDIASGLTQSLATTGVSSMTGPIKAASGSLGSPSYSFVSALTSGLFLAGTNQIGWSSAGVLGATFNNDLSVTWYGGATWAGDIGTTGNFAVTGSVIITGSLTVGSNLGIGGNLTLIGSVVGSLKIGGDLRVVGSVSVGSNVKIGGDLRISGFVTASSDVAIIGSLSVAGPAAFGSGVLVVATASLNTPNYFDYGKQNADPASPAANFLRFYVKLDGFATGERPFAKDENGLVFPLMFTGGQCQLTKSGASLLLSPLGGNRLSINGVPQAVPDAGVSLAASNTAAAFVYIYAFMNTGTMTLEMSQTVPILQTGTGVKQKTGDATRTLVGAAYTDAGGAWADTDGKLWVISYFNRRRKASKTTIVVSNATATQAYIEVDSSLRNNFINWSDETLFINSKLNAANTAAAAAVIAASQNNLDGVTAIDSELLGMPAANQQTFIPNYSKLSGVTENTTHYISIYARSLNGNTLTYGTPGASGTTSGEGTALYINING